MKHELSSLLLAGLICAAPQAVSAQPATVPSQGSPPPSEQMPPAAQPQQPQGQPQQQAQQQQGQQPSQMQPPGQMQTQLQFKGKVSDVWKTKVDKQSKEENKIVLVETDQGQVVLADLGPAEAMSVKVEEGTPVMVTGAMMYLEESKTRRFVPQNVQAGKAATQSSAAQMKPSQQAKAPQKQKVSGKIVKKHEMNAKETKVDHQLMLVEVDPQTRVLVDLGPSAQLKNVELDEGDKVQVEGHESKINDRGLLVADKVQAEGKDVNIQREAAPRPTPSESKPPVMVPPPGQAPPPRQPVTP